MQSNPTPQNQAGGTDDKQQGVFIVLEGTDGSGKSTQYKKLLDRFGKSDIPVKEIKFPHYTDNSSYFVRQYLAGQYGTADELGPYTPSLFYALDRYDAKQQINTWLSEGYVVLADRYIAANKAHQGQKIQDIRIRQEFYLWLDQLELNMLNIPRPDLNIVLSVPPDIATKLIAERSRQARDIHDADPEHVKRSYQTYLELCKLYPAEYYQVDCLRGGKLMSIDDINNIIWERITTMLPRRKNKPAKSSNESTNDYVIRDKNNNTEITPAGQAWLDAAVTNSTDDVYGFTDKLDATTVAAAMARLSRRGDDMRLTLLEEFTNNDYDKKLLNRVITAFGDDSVQQLAGLHLVVENASNLLTKKLEWGRLAAYLEQSTRYIYFDKKDSSGKYRYYTPRLDKKMAAYYEQVMDEIFDTYAEVVHKLTDYIRDNDSTLADERDGAWRAATKAQACDAARGLLPVATTSTVGIYGSGQAIESLIMHLLSDEMPESRTTGDKLLAEARKTLGVFLERADKPDRGGAWQAYRAQTAQATAKLTDKILTQVNSSDHSAVRLVNVTPRNELDVIPYILYENSNLSLKEIQAHVTSLSYDQKVKVLQTYCGERLNRRHKPGRALENIHYSWDLLCDYGIFRDLQRHRMVDDLNWQKLTPRYGYDMPEVVESAGLSDLYEKCFDLSYQLYSDMQATGEELAAQYATLLGHKMRWKISYNAREAFHFHELRTSPQGHPSYRKLVMQMHEKLAEVHPILAEAMKFVNTDEDPELTRLAAERYTQYKLDQLDKK